MTFAVQPNKKAAQQRPRDRHTQAMDPGRSVFPSDWVNREETHSRMDDYNTNWLGPAWRIGAILLVWTCARSSARIERLPPEQKAIGSNPIGRTTFLPLCRVFLTPGSSNFCRLTILALGSLLLLCVTWCLKRCRTRQR